MDSLQDGYNPSQVRVIAVNLGDDWSTINFVVWGYSFLTLRDGPGSVWNTYKQNNTIPLNYVIERSPQKVHGWMEGYNDTQIRQWITECLIGVEENSKLKTQNSKLAVSPNPFTQRTVIRCSGVVVSEDREVGIKIYDLGGKLVKSWDLGFGNSDFHEVVWDGKDNRGARVPSGVYFCQLTNGGVNLIEKLVVAK